jgi:hypothetical protein
VRHQPSAVDLEAATLTVYATVLRIHGLGPIIQPSPSAPRAATPSCFRQPLSTCSAARSRSTRDRDGDPLAHFPSRRGRLGDPSNPSGDLRAVLDGADFPRVTSHVLCKTVATRLDDAGLSARQIADYLASRPTEGPSDGRAPQRVGRRVHLSPGPSARPSSTTNDVTELLATTGLL